MVLLLPVVWGHVVSPSWPAGSDPCWASERRAGESRGEAAVAGDVAGACCPYGCFKYTNTVNNNNPLLLNKTVNNKPRAGGFSLTFFILD